MKAKAFNITRTLETPGITNYTQILRTTTIENVTDTVSTFSQ